MENGKLKHIESRRMRNKNKTENDKNYNENKEVINSIACNMGNIINLAQNMLELERMKVQSDAILEKMKQDRDTLIAEAEAYAKRKNADTNSVVERMRIIQDMMRDFYQYNNSSMSGEEFSKVISDIITQMGRLD